MFFLVLFFPMVVFGCFCMPNEDGHVEKSAGDLHFTGIVLTQSEKKDNASYKCYQIKVNTLVSNSDETTPDIVQICTRSQESLCGVTLELETMYEISAYRIKESNDSTLYTSLCGYYHDKIDTSGSTEL